MPIIINPGQLCGSWTWSMIFKVKRSHYVLPFLLVIALLLAPFPVAAGDEVALPASPCNGIGSLVDNVPPGPNPVVTLWYADGLQDWKPAPCLGWTDKPVRVAVLTTGRFEFQGEPDELLQRFASVSSMTEIQYWSVTRRGWKPLFEQAYALDPKRMTQREDFDIAALASGETNYFFQQEAHLAGKLKMAMRVSDLRADRLVIEMNNVSAVRWLFTTIIKPGDYEFYYLLEREDGRLWRYYNLSRLVGGGLPISLLPDESFLNRAAAIFRYVAGYPTDAEPPVAPGREP